MRRPGSPPAPANTPTPTGRDGPDGTRREFEYVRHGTVSIIAALDVHTGQVLTETIARNDPTPSSGSCGCWMPAIPQARTST
ncbi:hypothetical protein ABH935_009315 [Catenulispora sp. GAS73]|uniref:hypothetical protein n=1 Tax=Catenulispora sp. GAS73 TaxID=3156269 RepID=UPI0035185EE5